MFDNPAIRRAPVILDIRERLEAFSIPEPNSGCWIWLGGLHLSRRKRSRGYGRTSYCGKDCMVHRVSWLVNRGEIPDGLSVLHHCDNRLCINPDHLFLGTQQDNVDDMLAKGRYVLGKRTRGEDSHYAKLTEKQARYVLANPSQTATEIARMFGVSRSCISHVRSGNTWSHLQ